jgi:MFS family permease
MVALVQSAATAPLFLLAISSGAVSDIVDRRRYLILAQFWMAGAAGLLGLVTLSGHVSEGLLLTLTFLLGVGAAMMMPAFGSLVPEVVERPLLARAIALNGIAMNTSRAAGPALSGFLIAWAETGYTFLVNAVFAGLVAVALLRWSRVQKQSALPSERFLGALRMGIRFARRSPVVHAVLARAATFFFFGIVVIALLPLFARQTLGGDAVTFSLLLTSMGVGAVIGAFIVPRVRQRFSRSAVVFCGALLHAAMTLAIGWTTNVYVAAAAMFFAGMAWMAVVNVLQVAMQMALPEWVRGRGLSIFQTTIMGGMMAGSAVWGQLATVYGLSMAYVLAAAGAAIAAGAVRMIPLSTDPDEDFTVTRHWEEPSIATPIENDQGPVLITSEYCIDPRRAPEFVTLMQESKRMRLRNGAISWGLFRDTADPRKYVEFFIDESWIAHLRQHERATTADRDLEHRKRAFLVDSKRPRVSHFIAEGIR